MKIRLLLLLLAMTSLATVAEAGCYQCRNLRPMPWYQGACVDAQIGLCSAQCCGQVIGTQCTLPDNDNYYCYDPPDGLATNRFFTSRGVQQTTAISLAQKSAAYERYQREAVKRRIPRRCGANV
ncbi:MAG TPA: hypothetical protein VEK11_26660 [Thermoanaerobaculia bacterium]|nr:hypothetical protein [Thermoanaerobaculia bacterium]